MKADKKILDLLNAALHLELTAIHQYLVHAEMQDNSGYVKLGAHSSKAAREEMGHVHKLVERIVFLEGQPEVGSALPVEIGAGVEDQLKNDLAAEQKAITSYRDSAAKALELDDQVTRDLFSQNSAVEEDHLNYLEAQIAQIKAVGLELYLAQQFD